MANDKRLLFLSWFFPPNNAIAAVRTGNIAQELIKHGWDITIVTMDPLQAVRPCNGTSLISDKLHYLYLDDSHDPCQQNILHLNDLCNKSYYFTAICRKLMEKTGHHEDGIYRAAMRACHHLKKGDFDLILASGSPFSQFKAAAELSQRLSCPFVLDYRDPWSQTPSSKNNRPSIRNLEKRTLNNAALALSVSPSQAELISQLGGKHQVISNGFNNSLTNLFSAKKKEQTKTIVYTGNLYLPSRDITPILKALALLEKRNSNKVNFKYYGNDYKYVEQKAAEFNLSQRVTAHKPVSKEESLDIQNNADLVLVVTTIGKSSNLYQDSIVTGKIFEPIALQTPVLLIAPESNDAVKIVKETGCGFHFVGTAIEELADFLAKGEFSVNYTAKRFDYCWDSIGAKLDSLLSGLIK